MVGAVSSKTTGRVKFFNSRAGFGFIVPDSGGREVFLSTNAAPKGQTLKPDQPVKFLTLDGKRGPYAVEVELI